MRRSICLSIYVVSYFLCILCFFFNDTATTEIYTLSLHDALPICKASSKTYRKHSNTDFVIGSLFRIDRKSTRLNSSHANISYAVFCLKKKTNYKSVYMDTDMPPYPYDLA